MQDYWADGHMVAADNADEARAEVKRLYDHDAEKVIQVLGALSLPDFKPQQKVGVDTNGVPFSASLGYDEDQVPLEGDPEPYEDGPWIVNFDSANMSGWTAYFPTRAEAEAEYESVGDYTNV